jgi:hypothetical protein
MRYGRYVVSKRLANEGFGFAFPTLRDALANLLTPGKSGAPSAENREAPANAS